MTTKLPEKFTYKTTTIGDGSLYAWVKYNEKGEVVERSTQTWNTEADAEKAIRTIAGYNDTVEVVNIKNINPDANANVQVVEPQAEAAKLPNPKGDELHGGAEVVHESIEDAAKKEDK